MTNEITTANTTGELIQLTVTKNGETAVSGRLLHEWLGIETPYAKWFERMKDYGFAENIDFLTVGQKCPIANGGFQERVEHILKLDMAKEVSMIQRTEKGKQARLYFIECEKKLKEVAPLTIEQRALALIGDLTEVVEKQKAQLVEQKPAVEFYDEIGDAKNNIDFGTFAKELGTGRNRLFEWCREQGIIQPNSTIPYQQYVDQEYFDVIQTIKNGFTRAVSLITPKGEKWLTNKYISSQNEEITGEE